MTRTVLAGVEDAESLDVVTGWTSTLARAFGAGVVLVHVVPPPPTLAYADGGVAWAAATSMQDEERRMGGKLLAEAKGRIADAGVDAETVLVSGPPAREIVRVAEDRRADFVVLGSRRKSRLDRILLGATGDAVKNHVAGHVLLARSLAPPSRTLIAIDGSPASRRAATLASELAAATGSRARAVHVVPARDLDRLAPPDRAEMRRVAEERSRGWIAPGVESAVEVGDPATEIVRAARELPAGLIVMGTRGLGGLASLVAGSVSNAVAHTAEISVLLVKDVTP